MYIFNDPNILRDIADGGLFSVEFRTSAFYWVYLPKYGTFLLSFLRVLQVVAY